MGQLRFVRENQKGGRRTSNAKEVKKVVGKKLKKSGGKAAAAGTMLRDTEKIQWVSDSAETPPVKALVHLKLADGSTLKSAVTENTTAGALMKVRKDTPPTASLRRPLLLPVWFGVDRTDGGAHSRRDLRADGTAGGGADGGAGGGADGGAYSRRDRQAGGTSALCVANPLPRLAGVCHTLQLVVEKSPTYGNAILTEQGGNIGYRKLHPTVNIFDLFARNNDATLVVEKHQA